MPEEAAIARISTGTTEVLKKRDIVERFTKEGVEVGGISRESFGAFLAIEIIKSSGHVISSRTKPVSEHFHYLFGL